MNDNQKALQAPLWGKVIRYYKHHEAVCLRCGHRYPLDTPKGDLTFWGMGKDALFGLRCPNCWYTGEKQQ